MTNPTPTSPGAAERVGDLDVTAETPVLQRREPHPEADPATLPIFGDTRWNLFAALSDRHTAQQILNWQRYPAGLRHSCKLYTFALINITEDPPRLRNARSTVPGIKTIVADLGYLHIFAAWLTRQGITVFNHVTPRDLDAYQRHITDTTATSHWKRKALLAVQRLHAYREHLPARCQLPATAPWGGASAAELAETPAPRLGENRTPRIHPDVMQPLLSAALLTIDTIAPDLLPTLQRLITMRHLAHRVAPPARRKRTTGAARREALHQHLIIYLAALARNGHTLPGRTHHGATVLDVDALTIAGWLDATYLRRVPILRDTLHECDLPITPDLLRVTQFRTINGEAGTPWRTAPVETAELTQLMGHLRTAAFLAVCYLSGIRTGEALNLRCGCISHDPRLNLIFLSGQQMKATDHRRERTPDTIPWVVTEHTARAVAMLEQLTPGTMLFPHDEFLTQSWFDHASSRSRTPGRFSGDIAAFITWFNTTIAPALAHPPIGDDPHGPIIGPRLRRTLAWHIVRRPGGTVAGATQYGHLHAQLISGYAGHAGAGFLDDISFEEFLLRAETIHDDQQRLLNGEHVSGPAADTYRQRAVAAARFAGLTITTPAQVGHALSSPDLNIHHGALLTCVYRRPTAACQTPQHDDQAGPEWSRCRLSCANIAYTDRDITRLRRHAEGLAADVAVPGLPQPLRQRIQQRLDEHEEAIARHDASRNTQLRSNP
jgi:integrase